MSEEQQEVLTATLRATIETRPDQVSYVDHGDLASQAKRWIEEGLSDRADISQVAIEVGLPGRGLAEQLNSLLVTPRPVPGCNACSEVHTVAPCECGHAYHGHGRMGLEVRRRCLSCPCKEFKETDDYVRCGAWGGCPMPLGHNRGHSDVPENHQSPEPGTLAAENPAAYALARYVEGHPASTVMAACRELGWQLTFEPKPVVECVECQDSGACNGDPCPLHPEQSVGICATCKGRTFWIEAPTGGWWAHGEHPSDHHDAVAEHCGCPAGLLPRGSDPMDPCVVQSRHRVHRTALGESWVANEAS